MNSEYPFHLSRIQLRTNASSAFHHILYPPRLCRRTTDVSSDQITFFQSSIVQCSCCRHQLYRASFIFFVNPGFLVGFVFLKPTFLRMRQTVAAEILNPSWLSAPATSAQDFSRP
ncbi:hypothetical protein DPSP01_014741 [Paraphaeosphaeria sporulosa]